MTKVNDFKLPPYCHRRPTGKIRYRPRGGKGVTLPVPVNATRQEVFKAYDRLVIESRPNSLKSLFDAYTKTVMWTSLSPRTQTDYTNHYHSMCKYFSKTDMSKVRTSDFAKWRDLRAFGENGAPTQCGKEVKFLTLMIRHACEYDSLGPSYRNQIADLKPPRIPKETTIADKEVMTTDMFFKILKQASPEVKVVAMFSYITGLRLSDVLSLKKTDVMDDGTILTMQSKTKVDIHKSATSALLKVIEAAYDLKGHQANIFTPFLIPNSRGRQYTASGFGANWCRTKSRVFPNQIGGAPVGFRTRFHDLRHRGTTDYEGDNKADFTGHKGEGRDRMAEHYNVNKNAPIDSPSLDITIPDGLFK